MPCNETDFVYALTHLQEGNSFLLLVRPVGSSSVHENDTSSNHYDKSNYSSRST